MKQHSELVIPVNNNTSMSLKHRHFDIVSYPLKTRLWGTHLLKNWLIGRWKAYSHRNSFSDEVVRLAVGEKRERKKKKLIALLKLDQSVNEKLFSAILVSKGCCSHQAIMSQPPQQSALHSECQPQSPEPLQPRPKVYPGGTQDGKNNNNRILTLDT